MQASRSQKPLRQTRYTRIYRFLMLTAVSTETGYDFSQELDGYWMKTDDYASKPLLPDELVKKVNSLWRGRRKRRNRFRIRLSFL